MMAAYWKSPYKEPSHFNSRGSSSTGRFEQSLSLTRAKSSILTSGQDLFEWHLSSSRRPGSSQPLHTTANGNLKGILKTSKGTLSPRSRVSTDGAVKAESSAEQKANPQRPKRVSFGPCDDAVDSDSEYGLPSRRGLRAHYITLQRLSHSRKVEESAMQRLSKLISGGSMKHSPQSGPASKSASKISPLPVVDGKGLLTPRSEQEKTLSSCKHSSDLKCVECSNKDVETGEIETKATTTDLECPEDEHESTPVFGAQAQPDSTIEHTTTNDIDPISKTVKVALPITLLDGVNSELVQEKTTIRRRTTPRKSKPVSFHNKTFQSKLLPGRYPFNTGAIHTRNANMRRKDSDKSRPDGEGKTDTGHPHDVTEAGNNQGDVSTIISKPSQHQGVYSDSTRSQSSETCVGNVPHLGVTRARSDSRDRRCLDKTSQILTWLKDVRQKQNFKPRNSRFVAIESQISQ